MVVGAPFFEDDDLSVVEGSGESFDVVADGGLVHLALDVLLVEDLSAGSWTK